MTRLKRVVSLRAGGTPRTTERQFWAERGAGTPWVTIGDMSDGRLVRRTDRYVSQEGIEAAALPVGDPGVLLFAMYATVGAVAQLGIGASWNQAILEVQPIPSRSDVRFVGYWLEHLRPSLRALSRSNTQDNLNAEQVANLPFPSLDLADQRAIADFLDAETARIDGLIAKKRRMMEAFSARLAGLVELQVRAMAEEYGEVPLRFTVPEVTVGIVVTPARWYSAEGVPAIRGVNVRPGRIDMGDLVYLTAEGNALHEKSVLREGDLVVVRTGQAGSAAVVPKELDGANCIDVLLIRRSAALLPRYLEYVINSDWTRKHIEAHSVGTIQSHFNVGALRELRIPVPESTVQEAVVRRLDKDSERVESLTSALERQIGLLAERRQALITAAVTGELDVAESIAEAAS